jgi:hypothetical protein
LGCFKKAEIRPLKPDLDNASEGSKTVPLANGFLLKVIKKFKKPT